jgi:hypothetical protein
VPRLIQSNNYDLKRNFSTLETESIESYTYSKSKDLIAWLRFVPQDKPKNDVALFVKSSAQYIGSFAFSEVELKGPFGYRNVKTIEPQDEESYILLDGESINFTSGSFVTGSNEKSFSVSTWIKRFDSTGSFELLNFNGRINSYHEDEENIELINAIINHDEQEFILSFFDHTEDVENPKSKIFTIPLQNNDEWAHIALSFDSEKTADQQVNFWINGNQIDPDAIEIFDDGYQNPIEIENAVLNIGRLKSDEPFALAEFALWKAFLNDDDAKAIYLSTTSKIKTETSGFLSESPRLQIRSLDHVTGSYPGNSSHGMPEFNGRYPVDFNDTKALNFISNYAKASIEFNADVSGRSRISNSQSIVDVLSNSNELEKLRIKFKIFDSIGFIQRTFIYVSQPSRLNIGNDELIVINAVGAKSANDLVLLLSKAINHANIGLEAKSIGLKINIRYHKPNIGSFEFGSEITTIGNRYRLIKDIKQFAFDEPNLLWPSMVPQSSIYSRANSIVPHRLDGIEAPGRMIIGISDSHVKFTPGQNLEPFNEHRITNVASQAFYAVGTAEEDLPGFSARLSSKDSFVIDVNPTVETEIYFSTGSSDIDKCSGLAYFNFEEKRWELIKSQNEVDFLSSDPNVATNSMLAVMPSTFWGNFPNLEGVPLSSNNIRHLGKPSSFAGFPLASKFDATKQQLISVKDYIKAPFLVEKIEIQVEGVLGTYPPYESRAEFIDLGDVRYTNISGLNNLNRRIDIFYEWTSDIDPIITLDSENDDIYSITVSFLAGVTTAQQIVDAFAVFPGLPPPALNQIVRVEIKPDGNPLNVQFVE